MEDEKKKKAAAARETDGTAADNDEKLSGTWAADAQDDLEDWIEEQGIQLRY